MSPLFSHKEQTLLQQSKLFTESNYPRKGLFIPSLLNCLNRNKRHKPL